MRSKRRPGPSFAELYPPKLVTVLRQGYGLKDFRADAVAGLTVAIVALPLSMAIAIASGVGPERGLFTAIIGGFLVSALGGSRFQIGGPTGAFVVVVFNVIAIHGYDGLVIASAMAGLMLIGAGLMRVGTFIKYIPEPVVTGFTAGIAVIIATSQIKDFLGLSLAHEPAEFIEKVGALAGAVPGLSPQTFVVGLASRLSALGLLFMTLVIQVFIYPSGWPEHILWAAALLMILARGPGAFSLDHLIWSRAEQEPAPAR